MITIPVKEFQGWIDNPVEVDKVLAQMAMPLARGNLPTITDTEVFLYEIMREVTGDDAPKGPQLIGDCVSWGWGNLVNYIAVVQISLALKEQGLTGELDADDPKAQLKAQILEEYQEAATEVIYGLCRCEVGNQWNSRSDGAVGAWASEAVTRLGTISRKGLIKAGLGGPYDPKRAKEWGAKGLPDTLEPIAKQHTVKTTSLITNFDDAVAAIQNGYPVVACSNQGFSMERDRQGFCSPEGTWYHCMLFIANRFDRPGLCCSQSWGKNTPKGPVDKKQPDNTFWVDAKVVTKMLSQRDSFTGSGFLGYPAQKLVTWYH